MGINDNPNRRQIDTRRVIYHIGLGAMYYSATYAIVLLGLSFGVDFLPNHGFRLADGLGAESVPPLIDAMCSWDGTWYMRIAADGYQYDPHSRSSVAFFPVYPMFAAALARVSGLSEQLALLIVSNGFLVLTFAILSLYVAERYDQPDGSPLGHLTMLAFGLFPTTVFFRMAYTESMFLFFVLVVLLGIHRGWNPVLIALIVGLATGIRTVGVAISAAYCLGIIRCVMSRRLKLRALACVPVSFWGIAAYCSFLYGAFREPLAFFNAQSQWQSHHPNFDEWLVALLTLKPIWWVYLPSSPAYWGNHEWPQNPLFALKFANPLFFLFSCVLLGYGVRRKYLTESEIIYSATALGIPYVFHSYQAYMAGQARFASVSIATFLVAGQLLHRSSPWVIAYSLSLCAIFLFVYAALFASWFYIC